MRKCTRRPSPQHPPAPLTARPQPSPNPPADDRLAREAEKLDRARFVRRGGQGGRRGAGANLPDAGQSRDDRFQSRRARSASSPIPARRELTENPKIVALRDDPEIIELIRQQRFLDLLQNPKLIEAMNDPALAAQVRSFDFQKALDYALKR